jgi:hypothetical protein
MAPVAAESSRIKRFASRRSLPGRMITSTPTKPSTTAVHRRKRTFSWRISPPVRVAKTGPVKLTAVAVVNGTTVIP